MIEYKSKAYETELEQAIDIAQAVVTKKLFLSGRWWPEDERDARQDLALYVVEGFSSYDPDKGALTTWVYRVVDSWIANNKPGTFMGAWRRRVDRELVLAPLPAEDPDSSFREISPLDFYARRDGVVSEGSSGNLSDLALELIAAFPEKVQPAVALCWADGMPQRAAAERLGVTDRTVVRHLAEARKHIPQIAAALEAA